MAAPAMGMGGMKPYQKPGKGTGGNKKMMGEGPYTNQPGGASPASRRPISTGKVTGSKLTPKKMGK